MTFECSHVRPGEPLDTSITLVMAPHHTQSVPTHFVRDGESYVRLLQVCQQCALKAVNLTMEMLE